MDIIGIEINIKWRNGRYESCRYNGFEIKVYLLIVENGEL